MAVPPLAAAGGPDLSLDPIWRWGIHGRKLQGEERTSSALTHMKKVVVYTGKSVNCPASTFSAACSGC